MDVDIFVCHCRKGWWSGGASGLVSTMLTFGYMMIQKSTAKFELFLVQVMIFH